MKRRSANLGPLLRAISCGFYASRRVHGRVGKNILQRVRQDTRLNYLRFYSCTISSNLEQDKIKGEELYVKERVADLKTVLDVDDMSSFYPSFKRAENTISIKDFRTKYEHLAAGERLLDKSYEVYGRITSVRAAGKKLLFFTIQSETDSLQIIAMLNHFQTPDLFKQINDMLRRGVIISVEGAPGSSKTGELSVIARSVTLLAPCLRPFPQQNTLKDVESRQRKRVVDLLTNDQSKSNLLFRSNLTQAIRTFLLQKEFLEVETPILATSYGGASAVPFTTNLRELSNMELFLRISPELYLKRLSISGFDRVFEIGKCFRNEGMDSQHNPEFTICEFYQAWQDCNGLIATTEEMLAGVVSKLLGKTNVEIQEIGGKSHEIEFGGSYKRISFMDEIQTVLDCELPYDQDTAENVAKILDICNTKGKPPPSGSTCTSVSQTLNVLFDTYIKPSCIQPTFVCDHPVIMSPLSKRKPDDPHKVDRFELYVAGEELINAYSELNNPQDQRQRFGEHSIHAGNEDYCRAMEYALPPTAGWGLGIDRLCMLLTNSPHIREVLPFPLLKRS
eukprot:TRINITY_DN11965_c0_g1_i1.p1 TRINITY_DN11965_c0_g1~~TRINITY_DN11965_c0_g1_i1.p1  ORF type:complete len:563 (-),score=79.99 TRINITY_DN11965_c0_g1_i1:64-1752(-)